MCFEVRNKSVDGKPFFRLARFLETHSPNGGVLVRLRIESFHESVETPRQISEHFIDHRRVRICRQSSGTSPEVVEVNTVDVHGLRHAGQTHGKVVQVAKMNNIRLRFSHHGF